MILDFILYLIYGVLYGVISILPTMEILPESFQETWNFIGSSIANLFYVFGSDIAFAITFTLQTIVYAMLLLFVWNIFVVIWGLIRG